MSNRSVEEQLEFIAKDLEEINKKVTPKAGTFADKLTDELKKKVEGMLVGWVFAIPGLFLIVLPIVYGAAASWNVSWVRASDLFAWFMAMYLSTPLLILALIGLEVDSDNSVLIVVTWVSILFVAALASTSVPLGRLAFVVPIIALVLLAVLLVRLLPRLLAPVTSVGEPGEVENRIALPLSLPILVLGLLGALAAAWSLMPVVSPVPTKFEETFDAMRSAKAAQEIVDSTHAWRLEDSFSLAQARITKSAKDCTLISEKALTYRLSLLSDSVPRAAAADTTAHANFLAPARHPQPCLSADSALMRLDLLLLLETKASRVHAALHSAQQVTARSLIGRLKLIGRVVYLAAAAVVGLSWLVLKFSWLPHRFLLRSDADLRAQKRFRSFTALAFWVLALFAAPLASKTDSSRLTAFDPFGVFTNATWFIPAAVAEATAPRASILLSGDTRNDEKLDERQRAELKEITKATQELRTVTKSMTTTLNRLVERLGPPERRR